MMTFKEANKQDCVAPMLVLHFSKYDLLIVKISKQHDFEIVDVIGCMYISGRSDTLYSCRNCHVSYKEC